LLSSTSKQNNQWQQAAPDYAVSYSHQVKTYYLQFLKDFKAGFFQLPENTVGNNPQNKEFRANVA